ncbi:vWA domain-containing protein [Ornithinimicrobium cerasi]|uniref:vWA domain-containing protein n=1 Tax=Ornithinimicrobium cerasi TaxID=2248773 RepID=UPI000EFFDF57|nr:vWA domain-containing protein [Ornithinimicrobium cerasi]
MTDSRLTHIYFLLDRSGSMQSIRSDTVGGFAAFVEEQRAAEGECRVTLAQFDDTYEVVYAARPVSEVPPLDLRPRGRTALLDAMGRLVTEAGAGLADLPEEQRPGTVLVAVMTDGLENASREWTHPAIRSLVEQQTRDYGWQFLYMGADQDAVEVGRGLGVPAASSVTYARGKAGDSLRMASGKVADLRRARQGDAGATFAAYSAAERAALGEDEGEGGA